MKVAERIMQKPTKQNIEIGFMTLFLLLTLQISSVAQTRIVEVKMPIGELIGAGLDTLFVSLQKQPESRGLVVIYSGSKQENLGNVPAIIEGIKVHEKFRAKGSLINRISFIIAKGKQPLQQEYWIVKKGEELPEFEEIDVNFDNLIEKRLFASQCISCDIDYPRLSGQTVDYDLLADVLKKNSNYSVLVVITGDSGWGEDAELISSEKFDKNLRKNLSETYRLKKDRFKFKHIKSKKEEYGASMKIYIVPEKQKN